MSNQIEAIEKTFRTFLSQILQIHCTLRNKINCSLLPQKLLRSSKGTNNLFEFSLAFKIFIFFL